MNKIRWAQGIYDSIQTEEARRKRSESLQVAWERGDFAGNSEKLEVAHARGDFAGCMGSLETRRKLSEAQKAHWERGDFDSPETRRKMSEAVKAGWANGRFDGNAEALRIAHARGDFDGVHVNPSGPELAIAQALDDAGIEYETQYRLKGDGRPFDFLIGDRLLLEVDGHYWHSLPGRAEKDKAKTDLARERGYRLVRIPVGRKGLSQEGAAVIVAGLKGGVTWGAREVKSYSGHPHQNPRNPLSNLS